MSSLFIFASSLETFIASIAPILSAIVGAAFTYLGLRLNNKAKAADQAIAAKAQEYEGIAIAQQMMKDALAGSKETIAEQKQDIAELRKLNTALESKVIELTHVVDELKREVLEFKNYNEQLKNYNEKLKKELEQNKKDFTE